MRHAPFTLSLLASALLIYGCSKTPEPEIKEQEVFLDSAEVTQEQEVAPAPAAVAAKPAPAKKAAVEEPKNIEEEPVIQEEEVLFVDDAGDGEIQRTYNETQISDKNGSPRYESTSGRTYNESQMSQ